MVREQDRRFLGERGVRKQDGTRRFLGQWVADGFLDVAALDDDGDFLAGADGQPPRLQEDCRSGDGGGT